MSVNWQALDHEIIERHGVVNLVRRYGLKEAGQTNCDWLSIYSPWRMEQNPSAAVNVSGSNGSLGQMTDLGGDGSPIGPFEWIARITGRDWREVRDELAAEAGVKLPKHHRNGKSNGKPKLRTDQLKPITPTADELLAMQQGNPPPPFAAGLAAAKGVSVDAIMRCGAEHRMWAGQFPVVVLPAFDSLGKDPVGHILYRTDGTDFPESKNHRLTQRKTHLLSGSRCGIIIGGTRDDLKAAQTVWPVEGPPDMWAIMPHLPASHIAVSPSHGAGKIPDSFPAMVAGKRVWLIGDNDTAGQTGARTIAAKCHATAQQVRVVKLPGEVTQKHGLDVRDFFRGGGSGYDILRLAVAAEPMTAEQAATIMAEQSNQKKTGKAKPAGEADDDEEWERGDGICNYEYCYIGDGDEQRKEYRALTACGHPRTNRRDTRGI